jgi:hypothetical protein
MDNSLMRDFLIVILFVAMVLTPAVVAARRTCIPASRGDLRSLLAELSFISLPSRRIFAFGHPIDYTWTS